MRGELDGERMPEDPDEDVVEDEDEAANTGLDEVIRRVTSTLWSSSLRWCASSSV